MACFNNDSDSSLCRYGTAFYGALELQITLAACRPFIYDNYLKSGSLATVYICWLWSPDVFWSFARNWPVHFKANHVPPSLMLTNRSFKLGWSQVAKVALWRCTAWSLVTALRARAKIFFEWSAQAFLNIVLSCPCRESDFQDKSFGMFWAYMQEWWSLLSVLSSFGLSWCVVRSIRSV